jgi:hypothetical protein
VPYNYLIEINRKYGVHKKKLRTKIKSSFSLLSSVIITNFKRRFIMTFLRISKMFYKSGLSEGHRMSFLIFVYILNSFRSSCRRIKSLPIGRDSEGMCCFARCYDSSVCPLYFFIFTRSPTAVPRTHCQTVTEPASSVANFFDFSSSNRGTNLRYSTPNNSSLDSSVKKTFFQGVFWPV